MSVSTEELARVKGQGFLNNRGTDNFSGRVVPRGAVFSAPELAKIAQCAERFGNGKVAFTGRMTAEIVGIAFDQIEPACAFLREEGLEFGGTGAKVRPIVACKGTTCVYGNFDTQGLAAKLHDALYVGMKDVKLPHKFKIGVGGCPNSCVKPSLNDVGIEAHRVPALDPDRCRGCKACRIAERCPSRAAQVAKGKLSIDEAACATCGVCAGLCPFGAVAGDSPVYRIYVGGTWGKKKREGTPLARMVGEGEILGVVEQCILWYKENGLPKERFGGTIDRVGMRELEKALEGEN